MHFFYRGDLFGLFYGAGISLGRVTLELVQKMLLGLEKTRPNPISPFMFYFHKCHICLKEAEEATYEAALVME